MPRVVVLTNDKSLRYLTKPNQDGSSSNDDYLYGAVPSDRQVYYRARPKVSSGDFAIRPAKPVRSIPIITNSTCEPKLKWQTQSFPNCNMFHEMDMSDNDVPYLGAGTIRHAWNVSSDHAVLKTLRFERDKMVFSPHREDSHRRDAMASERLTWSKRVVDIYGYCSQSCVNELLVSDLEQHRKRGRPNSMELLRLSKEAALALADVHSLGGANYTAMVHKDVTHRNFLISSDGQTLKLNDFNLVVFPAWDVQANATCAFRKSDCTTYRSPEECRKDDLSFKLDLYMLGNTLYYILTKKQPLYRVRMDSLVVKLPAGVTSKIPETLTNSTDPAVVVLLDVIHQCWKLDPNERPTAREVADQLTGTYESLLK